MSLFLCWKYFTMKLIFMILNNKGEINMSLLTRQMQLKCNIGCDTLIHIQNETRDILKDSRDVCWFVICDHSSIVNSTQNILQMFIFCVANTFTEHIHFQWHICNINMLIRDEMVRFAQYESMVFENTVESLVVIWTS